MHKSKVSLSQALSEYSHEYGWLNPESAAFDKETLELCIFCFDYFYCVTSSFTIFEYW